MVLGTATAVTLFAAGLIFLLALVLGVPLYLLAADAGGE